MIYSARHVSTRVFIVDSSAKVMHPSFRIISKQIVRKYLWQNVGIIVA